MGDHDRAVETGQRALGMAKAVGDFALQVDTNYRLGQGYWMLGEYRWASELLSRNIAALEGDLLWERCGGVLLQSVASRAWLLLCLAELGAFAEGIALGEEGVRIAEAADHAFSRLAAYHGLGLLYFRQGALQQAIPVLERGLEVCQVWHIPLLFPWVASALGYAYALSGRSAEALPLLEQALEQATAMGMVGNLAFGMAGLSETYLWAGRLDEANQYAERALASARAYKERGNEGWSLRLLGAIAAYREPPEVEPAEAAYRQALALAEALSMRPLQAHCHLGLGVLSQRVGKREPARAALSTAIELLRAMGMTFWLPRAEAALAKVA